MLFHVGLHDVWPLGEFLKSREHGFLFGVVMVLEGLHPGDAEEQEIFDVMGLTEIRCLLIDAVEPANQYVMA